jgi:hypothetical protein
MSNLELLRRLRETIVRAHELELADLDRRIKELSRARPVSHETRLAGREHTQAARRADVHVPGLRAAPRHGRAAREAVIRNPGSKLSGAQPGGLKDKSPNIGTEYNITQRLSEAVSSRGVADCNQKHVAGRFFVFGFHGPTLSRARIMGPADKLKAVFAWCAEHNYKEPTGILR